MPTRSWTRQRSTSCGASSHDARDRTPRGVRGAPGELARRVPGGHRRRGRLRRVRRARVVRRLARDLPRPSSRRGATARAGDRSSQRQDRDHVRAQDSLAIPAARRRRSNRRAPSRRCGRRLLRSTRAPSGTRETRSPARRVRGLDPGRGAATPGASASTTRASRSGASRRRDRSASSRRSTRSMTPHA